MIEYKIYGLKVKDEYKIKYIGQTRQSLKTRLKNHKADFNRGTRNKRTNWIGKYYNKIEIILIEGGILTLEDCLKKEIQYIKLFKSFGANLKNGTDGGEGATGRIISIEERKKISDRMKLNNPMKNPDIVKNNPQNKKGHKGTPCTEENRLKSVKRMKISNPMFKEECRNKLSQTKIKKNETRNS